MLRRQSALADTLLQGGRDGPGDTRRLRVGEVRGWSLVQLASFATTRAEMEQAVRPLIGAELPTRVGEAVAAGDRRLFKTGPEQFWIVGPEGDTLAAGLARAVAPDVGAVTPLSHSRTRVFVDGAEAGAVLATGIPLDFHPDVFPIGHFAMTGLHHTPVLVHRSDAARYELYAMRTFAQSVWDWLTDAALPYGYDVAV